MPFKLGKLLPKRRWARWCVAVLLFLGLVWLIAPRLAAPYVRAKLQAMVASRLSAELRMGALSYLPPFGVRVRDARFVARDASGTEIDLLKIARLDLRLAKLPFGEGPLVIQRIDVADPELHLILTDKGVVGAEAFSPGAPSPKGPSLPPGTKLSDMFELRHFSLSGGRVVVEDRTRPESVPMVWAGISATSETSQSSRSAYTFVFKGDHKGVAAFNADGSFDLDALHVTLDKFDLAVTADPAQQTSGMPAQIQTVLRENKVAGKIGVRGSAHVPLSNMRAATFDVTAEVNEASARFDRADVPLDSLEITMHARTLDPSTSTTATTSQPSARPIEVRLTRFAATSRDARITIAAEPPPTFLIDAAANRWALTHASLSADMGASEHPFQLAGRLSVVAEGSGPLKPPAGSSMAQAADYRAVAVPSDLRVLPPKFPLPLQNIGGTGARMELKPGVIVLENISATYGGDAILLRTARIPLPDDLGRLKESFRIEEIAGRIDFRQQPNPPYPRNFGKVVEALRPEGAFEIGGGSFYELNRVAAAAKRKAEWFFGVSTDAGSLTLSEKRIRISDITGDATVSNLLVDVTRLKGSVFGGTVSASGKVVPKKPFPLTDGRIELREVDLAELARTLKPESPNEKLVGRGFLTTTLAGAFIDDDAAETPAAQTFSGKGEFEVIQGHLWTLPVLGEVASRSKPKSGLTLGEAAGVFHLAGGGIVLDNAAVSSPALALMGTGRIGFDKSIDLQIVAAPLGDWRDQVRRTKIPIVSDVAGEVVGGVQRLLNAATSTLLYQFRVTGTLDQSHVKTVPAPVLTDPTALLLGRLLDPKTERRLLDMIRPKPTK